MYALMFIEKVCKIKLQLKHFNRHITVDIHPLFMVQLKVQV